MKTPNYVFDDELYHHGILGQRWGHRRFQNEDGSWTAAGRERYGEGDNPHQTAKPKVDARTKARVSFEEKKYKMYMKSKEQKLKDKIAAKEERNRVREAAKTERLARKEQAKIDKKVAAIKGTKLGKTKNMSDDDLQTAINRLQLEVEYNKSYALASKPNSALARADRFFSGPTGEVVKAVAVATLPKVAEKIVDKTLTANLKYSNKIDRDKAKADIAKTEADTAKIKSETRSARREAENKLRLDNEKAAQEKLNSDREFEQQKLRDENEYKLNKFDKQLEYRKASAQSHREDLKVEGEQKRLDELQAHNIKKQNDIHERDMKRKDLDYDIDQAEQFGLNKEMKQKYGDNATGKVYTELAKQAGERNIANERAGAQLRAIQSGQDYETLKKKQELEGTKMIFDRAVAVDDDLRNLVKQGKISGDTFAKTITSVSFGDTVASISRSQNPVVKDIANTITKNDFNYLAPGRESAIKSATGTVEEIAKRFGVSPSTVYKIKND